MSIIRAIRSDCVCLLNHRCLCSHARNLYGCHGIVSDTIPTNGPIRRTGQLSRPSDSLGAGRSGHRIPADPSGRTVLRRGSTAACLLGWRVRILPQAWISVSCVLQQNRQRNKYGKKSTKREQEKEFRGKKNSGGTRFYAPVQTGLGALPASYKMGTGFLPEGSSGLALALTIHSHQAPRIKKNQNYASIPYLGLRGLLQSEIQLFKGPIPGRGRESVSCLHRVQTSQEAKSVSNVYQELLFLR